MRQRHNSQTQQQPVTRDLQVAPAGEEGVDDRAARLHQIRALAKIVDAHDLAHYALMDDEMNVIPETHRGKVGIVGRNALGSVVSGVAPAARQCLRVRLSRLPSNPTAT